MIQAGDEVLEVAKESDFNRVDEWHAYRLEVRGNTVTLLIDGNVMGEHTADRYMSAGKVGLWSNETALHVRSFRVVAL